VSDPQTPRAGLSAPRIHRALFLFLIMAQFPAVPFSVKRWAQSKRPSCPRSQIGYCVFLEFPNPIMLKTKLTSWSNFSMLCQSLVPRRALEAPLKKAALLTLSVSWNCEAPSLLVGCQLPGLPPYWAPAHRSSSYESSFACDRSTTLSCLASAAGASFERSTPSCGRCDRRWPPAHRRLWHPHGRGSSHASSSFTYRSSPITNHWTSGATSGATAGDRYLGATSSATSGATACA